MMSFHPSKNGYNGLFLIALVSLFAYILVRTVNLDITNDEAYSFRIAKKFWYVEALCTPNTHWLNLAAIKIALWCGLESNWQIRWLSILSSFIFLGVAYYWIRSEKELYTKFFILSFAMLNPFVLDYFSLARGYASGLMFQALALLLFMNGLNKNSRRLIFASLLLAGVSAIANFGFFFFFATFALVYFYECYFKNGFLFFRQRNFYVDLLYSLGISVLVFRALLFIKRCSTFSGLSDGDSFVDSIFGSFIDGLLYGNFSVSSNVLHILSCVMIALVLYASLVGLFKYKHHNSKLYSYSSFMLLFIFGLLVINKFCFHFSYPSYRTSIMLFPLLAIVICSFASSFSLSGIYKRIALYAISIFLSLNFILSINFKSTFDCFLESGTKSYFDYLENAGAKHVGIAVELYGTYVNYYQLTDKYSYSFSGENINPYLPIESEKNNLKMQELDYLVLTPTYNLKDFENNETTFECIQSFPYTNTMIVKVVRKNN